MVAPLPTSFRYPTDPYPNDSVKLGIGQAVSVAPDLSVPLRGSGSAVAGFHVSGGVLPPGLVVDGDTGVISGTPDLTGIQVGQGPTVTVSATLTRGGASSTVTAELRFVRST